MQYLITFLEGVISFISPCMLPMLPLYLSYFAGGGEKRHVGWRAAAFVAGFTVVFCLLGVFAGLAGAFLTRYQTALNLICGAVVILFGLSYLEIVPLPFFRGMRQQKPVESLLAAFVFGVVYSVSLTPCVGAFLGSAILLASTAGNMLRGLFLLLLYSLGLGIPFLLSAVLLDKLTSVFQFIKKHYRSINLICGLFLILVGVMMALGMMNKLLAVI